MKILFLTIFSGSLILGGISARAGDAVAIAYNAEGVWIIVTYYCSPTPKGGTDYKNEADARDTALRDVRRRAGVPVARAEVLASSDSTSFVTVARGEIKGAKDVTAVAYGKSQAEADEKVLATLDRHGATAKQKIIYRYFTHGSDSAIKHE
jgi:hypothetical protein